MKSDLPTGHRRSDYRRQKSAMICCLLSLNLFLTGCGRLVEHLAISPVAQRRSDTIVKIKPGSGCDLVRLQIRDGTKIAAEFAPALDGKGHPMADPEQQPTLIFFYGNGSCLEYTFNRFNCADYFRQMGMNVLVPEYPGFGMSEGKPTVKHLRETAEAAYGWLTNRPGVRRDQVFISGFSLGTLPAIDLASRQPVAGLILFGPFTDAKEMARAHTPQWLHWARWMIPAFTVWRPMNNLANIRKVSCPVLIVHGTKDTTAPIEMADRLASAVATKLTQFSVQGAEHDAIWNVGGAPLWEAINAWVHHKPSGYRTLEADTFLTTLERKGRLPGLTKGDDLDGTLERGDLTAYPLSISFEFHGAWADVTPKIKSLAAGGPGSIAVNNQLTGRDPAPNIHKQLRVELRRDGRQETVEAIEGANLCLPAGAEVVTALYGDLRGQPSYGSIWHYTVIRESDSSPWKLHRAWRTDANGRVIEEQSIF
jgi:uncharacterized protein